MLSKNTTALIMHAHQEQFSAHFPALTENAMAQDGQNAYEMMEEHARKYARKKEWNAPLTAQQKREQRLWQFRDGI
mgnify:CR=1 FL=1